MEVFYTHLEHTISQLEFSNFVTGGVLTYPPELEVLLSRDWGNIPLVMLQTHT